MHFSNLSYKLSEEKLPIIVLLLFVLYMPDSTQFVQEMTSKHQERSIWAKAKPLEATTARVSEQIP